MTYKSPTLSELITRNRADIVQYTQQRNLVTDGIAFANAANAYGLHEHLNYIQRNIVPDKADEDYLLDYCNFWGVWRKLESSATGKIDVTVTGATQIESGTVWQRNDGVLFEAAQSLIIGSAGVVSVPVVARVAGSAGNTAAGDKVTLLSPVLNMLPDAVVSASSISGGADVEGIESLRARLRFRVQYPPSGGTRFDYVRWALECAGVTRAWCVPAEIGYNCVEVLFVCDDRPNIFPTQSDIERVAEYINGHVNPLTNQWEGKPPCTELIVRSPEQLLINPVIHVTPDTPDTRAAVNSELVNLLLGSEPAGIALLSQLRAAVSNASGVIDNRILSPLTDVHAQDHQLIVLGDVTWQ